MSKAESLAREVVTAVRGLVAKSIDALSKRIDALELRFKTLEETPPVDVAAEVARAASAAVEHAQAASADAVLRLAALEEGMALLVLERGSIPQGLEERMAVLEGAERFDPAALRQYLDDELARVQREAFSGIRDEVNPLCERLLSASNAALQEAGLRLAALESAERFIPPDLDARLASIVKAAIDGYALEFERRAQGALVNAIASVPRPEAGRNGLDGLGFEDLDVEYDGERALTLCFQRGEQVRRFTLDLPVVIDRGVYRDAGAAEYRRGDGTTYGGSWWIAQKDAPEGAPGTSKDWRLAVKKGRDGKDGTNGIDRTQPAKVGP